MHLQYFVERLRVRLAEAVRLAFSPGDVSIVNWNIFPLDAVPRIVEGDWLMLATTDYDFKVGWLLAATCCTQMCC